LTSGPPSVAEKSVDKFAAFSVTEDVAKVSHNATVVTENAANLSALFSATLGGPLVKTAALTYGVRKALRGRSGRRAAKRVQA
jgi:hypothetical protein